MKRLSSTLKDFVEKQELVRIAWTDGGGARVVPLWFVIVDREHYIGTGSDSAKWKAMKKRARVGWVIDGGKKGKYKGLSMHGEAEEVTDRKLREGSMRRSAGSISGRRTIRSTRRSGERSTIPARSSFI